MTSSKRKPTSVGEILKLEFLKPLEMSQRELAHHIGCDIKVINRLVNGKTSLTAEMALKFAATFETTPEFWFNAQKTMDLYKAAKSIKKLPKPLIIKGVPVVIGTLST